MCEVRNLNSKRVGDISDDKRLFVIQIKDCITKISVNSDGTLNITQERINPAA